MADDDENMKKNPISCVSTNQTVKLTNRSDEQQQQQSIHSSNGEHILKLFGYGKSLGQRKYRIHLQQLWSQMLEYVLAIRQQCSNVHHHYNDNHYSSSQLYQVSLATILNEFAQLKIQHDHMMAKCEGLESQLEQANCRAEFLAQEVDEQHLRLENASKAKLAILEKKYQDQIRLIEMDFSREKEIMIIQSCHLRQDIDRQMNAVQEQLSKFRSNIKILEESAISIHSKPSLAPNSLLVDNFVMEKAQNEK
ncbi:hypothetical protein DERF_007139 [Dermatophagoides farinae]|uniref:Uncharacterized protein n=1 Tax=Dermatophagoides farinae TaxID=6954 RepID=A0A922L474_DERFA|nr:hypothetical protein DERF_007139 [Dermatophagoides farinae]